MSGATATMKLRARLSNWSWSVRRRAADTRTACRSWLDRYQRSLRLFAWFVGSMVVAFGLLALADPYVQHPTKPCVWAPGWFGCALANHENLAGGCFTIVAALLAWAAVQEQLRAAIADRQVARTKLIEELEWDAEIVGAAWGVASRFEDNAPDEEKERRKQAVQYACEKISQPNRISRYRQMVALLSWDERLHFETLLTYLEALQQLDWGRFWYHDAIEQFSNMAWAFELLIPSAADYFKDLPRRWPKAMSGGDLVRRMAGEC